VPGAKGITRERMRGLYFTQPYSAEAERFFVRTGSPYTKASQPWIYASAKQTKVNHIVDQLQTRGTLKRLSLHYFHHDFASEARGFKVAALDQQVN
jgi:hypothetical protein